MSPNSIAARIPIIETFRGARRPRTCSRVDSRTGRSAWGGSGSVCSSCTTTRSSCRTSTSAPTARHDRSTCVALDIIRDRERGVPRFNEFRRQIGLRSSRASTISWTSRLPTDASGSAPSSANWSTAMREVYGQHRCDASKIITSAQLDRTGDRSTTASATRTAAWSTTSRMSTCVVGFHAETTRPHGFAISETQFHVFILNASRRLFSDRFFTSSFRPEFYTKLGIDWVMDNGPTGKQWEEGEPNGHKRTDLAAEACPAARDPGAGTGAGARRQRLRSVGE